MVREQFIAQNRPAGKPAPDMSVTLSGLKLDNPVVPASGTFGYGNEFRDFYDINILGSFSFKGTTREPRFGNPTPRIAECTAGMINAVGLQNPGIDAVGGEELAAQLAREGCRALAVQADVSKRDEVNAMVKTVEDTFGPISVLVNNAGVAGQALFQDVTDALWERYFAVNLNGARNTIQAVLPHMLHEKAGVIVNISSIWGQHGASCEVTYSCTKHALIGLTRSLAMELAPSGIRVNCVAPGVIDTDMVQVLGSEVLRDLAEQTPLGRLGTPQDIANAVAFLASEKASFITGQVLTVDGAFVG